MEVREAVQTAINHVLELFHDEKLSNLGLEEVEFDSEAKEWIVTVGFSRPWDYPTQTPLLAIQTNVTRPNRSYKVVKIADYTASVLSIKNREISEKT